MSTQKDDIYGLFDQLDKKDQEEVLEVLRASRKQAKYEVTLWICRPHKVVIDGSPELTCNADITMAAWEAFLASEEGQKLEENSWLSEDATDIKEL